MVEVKKMAVPALISGAVVGVFTAIVDLIPVVNLCNLACCLWLMAGGVLAAYLLKRGVGKIELKDGAIVGALGGVFFALVVIPLNLLFSFLGLRGDLSTMQQLGGEPVASAVYDAGFLVGIVFAFLLSLAVGVVFSAIGGVLGAKLLEK